MLKRTKLCTSLMIAFGGGALSMSAVAQQTFERVEITGSSIKRIDAETALPVTVIKREQIDKSGASNVQELVDRISSNNGGGRSLGESVGETSATGQTGASLRGLGRERTLVLLNGRRLANYPFSGLGTDLNAIPLAAIERIEILRDGASAIYGSDAIGGVINFITRKDYKGAEISVGFEAPTMHGGNVSSISGGIGFGDLGTDRFNILATANYQNYKKVLAADRSYAKTGNRPDIGIVLTSGNTFPANAFIAGPAGTPGNGKLVPDSSGFPDCHPPDSFNDGTTQNCRYDFTSKIDLVPKQERAGLLARGTFQLNGSNQLFAEAIYSRNEITIGSSQTPSTTTGKAPYLYPAGGRFYPSLASVDSVSPGYRGPLRISWRIVDGGQRTNKVTNEQERVLVGGEGNVFGWDYKVGLARAQSKALDSFVSGIYSDSRLVTALATGDINPFGPNDAAGLAALQSAALAGGENRKSKTTDTSFDATVSRDLVALPAGPLSLAVGVDLHKNKYLDGFSELAGSGDIVGGSGNAGKVEAKRDTKAVFAEVNIPVMKGLEAQVALRHDRYSNTSGSSRDGDFTSPDLKATSPKVGVRWQVAKELLFRASFGKGFRAPALDNLYAPASFTNTGGNYNDPFYDAIGGGCAAVPDTDHCTTQLTALNDNNPALKPEKSRQFSAGLVFEPMADLSLGIDYFHIKITDGVTALTGDNVLIDWFDKQTGPTTSSSPYADRLIVDPDTGYLSYVRASLENVGTATVAGYDFSARYRVRTAYGTFTPGWEATFLTKSTTSNIVTNEEFSNLGKYARGGPAVRWKQNVTLDYEQGPWRGGVRYFWQSGYEDFDTVSRVASYGLFDLQGQYMGVKNLTLTLGVRNLFNRLPPQTVTEDYFQVGFDPTYADVKGRTLYARAAYKFW
ncbi:MAG: TonB-dependent receptor [Caldimonas sp.]